MEASAERVVAAIGDYGRVTPVDESTCSVKVPTDDLEWAVFALGGLGMPFRVNGPPEAVAHFRGWAERLTVSVAESGSDL